jgi:hypothetical protein
MPICISATTPEKIRLYRYGRGRPRHNVSVGRNSSPVRFAHIIEGVNLLATHRFNDATDIESGFRSRAAV